MNSPDSSVTPTALAGSALNRLEKVAEQVDESDPDILPFFEEEAVGELGKIESFLAAWHEQGAGCPCPLADFRMRWHTLKGAANSVGQMRIGTLAGGMKDLLDILNSLQAAVLRQELTKVTVTVMEAIKDLLSEAHAPQYNHARKEQILKAAEAIMVLRQKVALAQTTP